MFTDNYDLPFRFWVLEKKLTQENCFLFCEKYENINDLNGLLKLENVPFNILSYRFECNDAMHLHSNYDSSSCFWVFEKRLTQKNCFLFCKKYGLLTVLFVNNQEIFSVLLSKRSWSAFKGDNILVFYTRSRVVSAMERVRSKSLYTNSFTRNEL